MSDESVRPSSEMQSRQETQLYSKPTVCISINTSWNIVNFRRSLISALQAQGYRVIALAPEDAFTPELCALVDAYYPINMQNDGTSPLQDLRLFFAYYRLLRRLRPKVLLGFTIKPNIYGTLAAALCSVSVINNVSGLGTVFIRHNWLTRLVRRMYRLAFRYSSQVFFQNPHDLALFTEHRLVRADKAALIAGSGIDLNAYQPQPYDPKQAGQACDFVLIARMLGDKGVREYVQAARSIKNEWPDCRFRLVGPLDVQNKTAIAAEEMEQWEAQGTVEYWGERADIISVIAQHDCVVLPSYREGLSRVLLEAAALARPIITTNVPGCADVVADGENGLLCRVRDAEDLARALRAFIALPAPDKAAMARRSRSVAESRFDAQQVHEAYLQHIKQVLAHD